MSLLGSLPGLAMAELYRYMDDRGVTVLDSRVPAEFVGRGYEVLDSQGRVKEVVPAAPTRDELEAARQARAEQERQAAADSTLLRLYGSTADLERARARQAAQIDTLVATSEGNLHSLQVQREELQRRAAAQERAGRAVDQRILDELSELDAETGRIERLISVKRGERKRVDAEFDELRQRLDVLLGD